MLDQDRSLPTALIDFPHPDDTHGPRQRWRFDQPSAWLVAHDPSQVAGLLDAAHALSQEGKWCVGWVAYEAAPGLNPHLPVKALPPGQPYAVWAVFDEAQCWDGDAVTPPEATWSMGPWQADLDDAAKQTQVERIRELIRQGELYQVNLTGQQRAAYEGQPASIWACFLALRRSQPAGYSLMLDARSACRAPGAVLSVSPELFFDWDGATLTTRPMKGTAARQPDASADLAAAEHLRTSEKERAENLMIVDLLRNDLSRIAEVGSVRVPSLFDVQALPTVWQMTSTITARSRPGLKLSTAFAALFPCGSVTGAPKRQAMHHIARLERSERGVYCGAAGLMTPGGRVTFNVPIRTVCVHTPPPPAPWSARCGIGSGITLDSLPEAELAEWRHKRAFLQRAQAPFQLLESLRLENGQVQRLQAHLQRMKQAALHFGYSQDAHWPEVEATLRQALQQAVDAVLLAASGPATQPHKIRLLLDSACRPTVDIQPLPASPHAIRVHWPDAAMPPADAFIRHKTTQRTAYDAFKPPAGCFDTLLRNAQGELTEFTIGNLAVQLDGRWLTPPLSAGLLPGVMRGELLASGQLSEATMSAGDLHRAQAVALINSVRGWLIVDLPHLLSQLQS